MDVILSVVVPTKNRYFYLDYLLRYFVSIRSKKIELIIHDNSDDDSSAKIKADLERYGDTRIHYYKLEGHISQTENCDLAISRASGEYVTMIGDDDIFSKHLVDYCASWSELGYEAVLPNKASYIWGDVNPRLYASNAGVLRSGVYTGSVVPIDVAALPEKITKLGGTDISNLPRVYHGIVKKSILDKVYEHCGSYCPGPSPDIANGIALCKYLTNYLYVDLPLITSGQCSSSAGGKGAQGDHYAEIDDVLQLPEGCALRWEKKVPFYWSGKTIYAESVLKAFRSMKMSKELTSFNYEYLYASCLVFDWRYQSRILNVIKLNVGHLRLYRIAWYSIKIMSARTKFHLKTHLFTVIKNRIFNQHGIVLASDTLQVAGILDDKFGPPPVGNGPKHN